MGRDEDPSPLEPRYAEACDVLEAEQAGEDCVCCRSWAPYQWKVTGVEGHVRAEEQPETIEKGARDPGRLAQKRP